MSIPQQMGLHLAIVSVAFATLCSLTISWNPGLGVRRWVGILNQSLGSQRLVRISATIQFVLSPIARDWHLPTWLSVTVIAASAIAFETTILRLMWDAGKISQAHSQDEQG